MPRTYRLLIWPVEGNIYEGEKNIAAIPPVTFLRHLRFDEGSTRYPGMKARIGFSGNQLGCSSTRAYSSRSVCVSKTGVDAKEFFIAVVQLPCGFYAHNRTRVDRDQWFSENWFGNSYTLYLKKHILL